MSTNFETGGPTPDEPIGPADRGAPAVHSPQTRKTGKGLLIAAALVTMVVFAYLLPGGNNAPVKESISSPENPANTQVTDKRTGSLEGDYPAVSAPSMPVFTPPPLPKIERRAASAAGGPTSTENNTLSPQERRMKGGVSMTKEPVNAARAESKISASDRYDPYIADPFYSARPSATSNVGAASLMAMQEDSEMVSAGSANGAERSSDRRGNQAAESASRPQSSFASQLKTTKLAGVAAARLPSQTTMLARGRLFECVLDTAIASYVSGQVRCTVPLDVYSEDGRLVVIDRGSEVTGEYSSQISGAQARMGILWVRAKTPSGVIIDLTSPASDNLGRAGVDGQIDTHFWDRFGAAIMLSVLDDAFALAIANARQSDTYVFGNTGRAGRNAAELALQNSINIPPTLIKNQGESVAIFLARDLDFSDVYDYKQLGVK